VAVLVGGLPAGCGLDTQAQGTGLGTAGASGSDGGIDAAADVAQTCLPTPGQKQCGTKCVEETDPDYGCGDPSCTPCSLPHATAACAGGACAVGSCDPGYLDCDGQSTPGCEVRADSDSSHCGDCDTDCSALDPSKQWLCSSGQCQLLCPAGEGDCNLSPTDGCETQLATDTNNCGTCGRPCSAAHGYGQTCNQETCSTSCYAPWGDCKHPAAPAPDDGCETDLDSDSANCGGCGQACSTSNSATQNCSYGTCVHTCQPGWSDCNGNQPAPSDDGCQTHTDADIEHCGSCYRPCSKGNVAVRACQGGLCTSTCNKDWGNCKQPPTPQGDDGCETYLVSTQDCGSCGRSCSTANAYSTSCSKGLCAPQCKPDWADCSSPAAPQADDGCECHGHCAGSNCKP